MDRKGKRGASGRKTVPKKRKFQGNRHSFEADTGHTSRSVKKLKDTKDDDFCVHREHGYSILNFFSVFSAISALVVCKICNGEITFSEASPRGLGFKIAVKCDCGVKYINSCPMIEKAFEINRRMVLAMRLLGIGINGIALFCGIMDICQGLSRSIYYACLENIYNASRGVYDIVTKKAVEEEKEENSKRGNPPLELTVSGNGTWKKRGFSSVFGIVTLIGIYSDKVIDAVAKSSFCQSCDVWESKSNTVEYETWKSNHDDLCPINHSSGSITKMEVDAVKKMFARSIEKYQVRYKRYVEDGDSEIYEALVNDTVYGKDFIVEKKECVDYLEKHMGTRLRNAREKDKGIGEKGSEELTDEVINELTTNYGLAMCSNAGSVVEMKKAIWATLDHKRSTDNEPRHEGCPEGPESWCTWRRAEAAGTLDNFTHDKPPLSDEVLEHIKPIYEDSTSDDLLERCLGAFTRNNDESFKSTIWMIAPKHLHSGKNTIDIANYIAVVIFNEGFKAILKMMDVLGIKIGPNAKQYAECKDNERIKRSNRRASIASKEAWIAEREAIAAQYSFFEAEEGGLYGPDS